MTSQKPTTDAFVATVKKSGLVEPDRLQKLLDDFERSVGSGDSSIALAEFLVTQGAMTKWQAEKLLQGKHKGYFLGKYRLLSLLGKGGMSSVFLAEHVLMRRRCAIKVLPTKRVADSSYLARFHREAQAVAALDHPNIVRAYDVDHQMDRDAEIHFLVMEYVEGASLQDLVANRGPCGFDDAVDYIRQAALGLEHAHRAGMVHRDIKPGNLLVDLNGTVKILDLGLARYFSNEEQGTALTIAHDEKVLGTADYLAPEQALDSHTVDHRADIYSLGCTLYFLLTGHPPFTEGTLAQRLMAHQTKEPPPVERDRPDTPPALGTLLRKMMAKKPEERQSTAVEVASDMLQWLMDYAQPAWKQSHSQLLGGLRGSDTDLARDTVATTSKAIPVAQPMVLTWNTPGDEADTEIVAREAWPTGDLAATAATHDSQPEFSAFLEQVASDPKLKGSNAKTGKAPSKSDVPAAKNRAAAKPANDIPSFDFLNPPALKTQAPPRSKATPVVAAKVTAPAKPPLVNPPPKPVVASPTPPSPTGTAFPNFDFSTTSPAPPDTAVAPPPSEKKLSSTESLIPNFTAAKPPLAVLIAAGIVGLALLGIVVGFFLGWFSEAPDGSKKDGGVLKSLNKPVDWNRRSLRVHGDEADFNSLQEALKEAGKNFRPKPTGADGKPDLLVFHVAEGTYQERVRINGSQGKTTWPDGIIVRGEGTVTFEAPDDKPVFSLQEVPGLTIDNLTIDAGNQSVGIEVSGFVTDTKLSNLKIRNFSQSGVLLSGVQAFGNPLHLQGVWCESKAEGAVGIRIAPDSQQLESNNVLISQCRLNGPLAAGVSVDGKFPYKIAIRESVFVKTAVGIRFQGAGRWQDFALANNTFFQCPIGIAFTAMPDAATGGLMIRRNLFTGTTQAEAMVQAGYNEPAFAGMLSDPAGLEWNFSDRAAPQTPPPGEINLFAINGKRGETGFAFDATDPKSPKFLHPSANSVQRTAPNPRDGEQPWVGAFGP